MNNDHGSTGKFVVIEKREADTLVDEDSLVLAWAKDRVTGEPRYILQLGRERRGAKSGCDCISCGLPLEAINVGRKLHECRRRPHFRHPKGAKKDDCLILSARTLAMQKLHDLGVMVLPRRRKSATAVGLSGKTYEAWFEAPKETVRVKTVSFADTARAILTLVDGRELEVALVGGPSDADRLVEEVTIPRPSLLLVVDDPGLVTLSPDDLRGRLRLIAEDGRWCSHWQDAALEADAADDARRQARDALDWFDLDFQLPEGITDLERRETLLHLKAKEILERERRMALPELVAVASLSLADGTYRLMRQEILPSQIAQFRSVQLEERVGQIRPDVMAVLDTPQSVRGDRILIEVTVTNGISPERAERIRSTGLPAVEIDISMMGGVLTETEFISLVVDDFVGKRWICHPDEAQEQARLLALLREELDRTPESVAKKFLASMADYGNAVRTPDGDSQTHRAAFEVVNQYAQQLADLGYREATDDFFLRPGHLVNRLQSIQSNTAIGYRLDSAWQVINAILQEHDPYRRWQTIYLMAIDVWRPTLTPPQRGRIAEWRHRVIESLKLGEDTYRRPPTYDKLIGLLFPELAQRLTKPLPSPNSRIGENDEPQAQLRAADVESELSRHGTTERDSRDYRNSPDVSEGGVITVVGESIEASIISAAGKAAGNGMTPRTFAGEFARKGNVGSVRHVLKVLIDRGVAKNGLQWS
jgi:hypothetical protein